MSSPVTNATTAGGALDQRFALDVQSVEALRRAARNTPEEALRQVSRQFEALFMGMLLKSMREANPSSGLLDGHDSKMYLSMLDQQMAQNLSGRGLKLADAMFAQLRRTIASPAPAGGAAGAEGVAAAPGGAPAALSVPGVPGVPGAQASGAMASLAGAAAIRPPRAVAAALPPLAQAQAPEAAAAPPRSAGTEPGWTSRVEHFIATLGESARAAAASTGIPERLILAQAALESAWGRREVRGDDGGRTFNVFGIKADRGWRGRSVDAVTTEVIDGVAQRVRAKFRAYGSYQEAFADYAGFLAGNPRYARVRTQADPARAAHELQRAGYATDPDYAGKLVRVMKQLAG
ncbi:flagellar assembly peptidoglycan hydrolase FlgJ [Ramlibacter sp.]|uniref:flagellar assembly peptidoglycan hydrolase FlgJ n=1 Tax=Ramlibacter sp. TaxID=1917967 RepID=UPI002C012C72|nr:flagellar assembly peptidoglycan hydrolase FlgJ [Ramlibacter sp.]HWI82099.1 flagellar assembly peptidoglycan hydrolase FlgJ [Ramlibacter sp.]